MQCEDITSLQKMENVYLNTALILLSKQAFAFCKIQ